MGSTRTLFVYDQRGRLISEFEAPSGALNPAPEPAGSGVGQVVYNHADHLGSSRLQTDSGGNVSTRREFRPYGTEITPTPDNALKFTGKMRDDESKLDYFGARYCNSALGRWMSADPVQDFEKNTADPQRWNLYAYVSNNPLKYFDPDGAEQIAYTAVRDQQGRIVGMRAESPFVDKPGATQMTAMAGLLAVGIGLAPFSGSALAAAPGILNLLTRLSNTPSGQEAIRTGAELATGQLLPPTGAVGLARELRVAELTGGHLAKIAGRDMMVEVKNVGQTGVDVIGKAGELIHVGGPAKGFNLAEFGQKLSILKMAAEALGVKAQAYFVKGTPEAVLKLARKKLGKDAVFEFVAEAVEEAK